MEVPSLYEESILCGLKRVVTKSVLRVEGTVFCAIFLCVVTALPVETVVSGWRGLSSRVVSEWSCCLLSLCRAEHWRLLPEGECHGVILWQGALKGNLIGEMGG